MSDVSARARDQVRALTLQVVEDARTPLDERFRGPIEDAIGVARDYYAHAFGIQFDIRRGGEWKRAAEGNVVRYVELLDDLAERSAVLEQSLVVGLSGAACLVDDELGEPTAGLSDNFGRCILIRWTPEEGDFSYFAETLIHEIAHTFGAWHSGDSCSSMRLALAGPEVLQLDEDAADVVEWTKWRDVRSGIRGISDDIKRKIASRYLARNIDVADHPIVAAWATEVRRAVQRQEFEAAISGSSQVIEWLSRDLPGGRARIDRWIAYRRTLPRAPRASEKQRR